jgi:hypothetical protein
MDATEAPEETSMAPRRKTKTSEESSPAAPDTRAEVMEPEGAASDAAQIGFEAFRESTEVRIAAPSASHDDESQSESHAATSEATVADEHGDRAEGQNEPGDGSAPAASDENVAPNNRRRIEEQLEALKRREAELRRELAIADHPELAEPLRLLEGHTYAVARVEAKMAQGLSKAEERRRETLEKKLASLREKRLEIDTQIAELEAELAPLGEARMLAFEAERKDCMERLLAALGTHEADFQRAGLDTGVLVPDLSRLMPEIRSLAETLSKSARATS